MLFRQNPSAEGVQRRDHHAMGALIRLGATFGFATMAALSKLAAQHGVATLEIALYRCLFALPPIFVWIWLGPGLATIRTGRPGAHAVRSALGFATMLATFAAIILLPLADAATISFAAPLFATMLSAPLLREKIGRHRWAAIVLGLVGVVIVMQPGGESLPMLGLAVAVAGAAGTSLVTVTMRQIIATEPPSAIVFWFTFSTALVAAILLPIIGERHDAVQWMLLLGIGLNGAFMQIMLTTSLRYAPVSVVAPIDYFQLIWATGFGWLIWSAAPSLSTLVGGSLIAGSGLYTLLRERGRPVTVAAEAEPTA